MPYNKGLFRFLLALVLFSTGPSIAGFEIGNGKRILRNEKGRYELKTLKQLEAGIRESLTEVVSPLSEGTPRSRLQIDIIPSKVEHSTGATIIEVGGREASQYRVILPNGVHKVEILVPRESDTVAINIEGVPGLLIPSSFDRLLETLATLSFF